MFKSLFQITSLLHITASLENTPNMLSWFSLHVWRHLQAQRQTQQDKRLCLRRLSVRDPHPPTPHTPPFPPQPPIYLGGCYREGRWLITINRTERESEQGGRAHQLTGPRRPKLRKWKPVARREEKQLYGNTKLIPPSDLILHAPPPAPSSLLWGPSLLSAGWGQMVDGPHRLYSWTQATLTQSDLAWLNHTSSRPTYENQERKELKPGPSAKNRSTLVAHRKRDCTIDGNILDL